MSRVRCAARKVILIGALAAALPVAVYLGGIVAARPLLDSETTLAQADVIVVLGGDGPPRASKAAALWFDGRAREILISGDGDCGYIAGALIADAVSPNAITVECRSGSTWQNAAFSAPLLDRMAAKTAIIVTNYFHERRALLSFRHFCPGVRFAPASVRPAPFLETVFGIYGPTVMKEYVKVVAYELRVRITSLFGEARAAGDSACIIPGGGRS